MVNCSSKKNMSLLMNQWTNCFFSDIRHPKSSSLSLDLFIMMPDFLLAVKSKGNSPCVDFVQVGTFPEKKKRNKKQASKCDISKILMESFLVVFNVSGSKS